MVHAAKLGHPGGDLSAADILVALYFGVMRVDPERPRASDRDRFIMSKGHCSGALYSTLALRGFFPAAELESYMQPLSRLNGHPNRKELPGVEANTGPLGHGLPIGVGAALAAQMDGAAWRTYVLTGDGELQEGSNWEAIMAASQYGLDNLTVIVDRNGIQQGAPTESTIRMEPLADRFRAFGWAVRELDGHNCDELMETFGGLPMEIGKPSCVIARTVKGKGVSFIEGRAAWHHRVPTDAELASALEELGGDPIANGGAGDSPALEQRTATWDAASPAAPQSGQANRPPHQRANARATEGETFDCRDAFARTLEALAEGDPRVVAVVNDSVGSTRLGKFGKTFPQRLVNVGIAEQNMIGIAAGLANGGKIPFVCAASCFLTGRALEQVKVDVAYSQANVKLCGMSSGLAYGALGPTHHSIEDLAWTRAIAGLTVIVPADPEETAQAVRAAWETEGPYFLRLSRLPVPAVHAPEYQVRVGVAAMVRPGTDIALIANGTMVCRALEAAALLQKSGVSARVLNVATLQPLDRSAIVDAARTTGAVVTVEEHSVHGGLGGAVAEVLATTHPTPMRILGVPGAFAPTGSTEWLFEYFGLTPEGICAAALELLEARVRP